MNFYNQSIAPPPCLWSHPTTRRSFPVGSRYILCGACKMYRNVLSAFSAKRFVSGTDTDVGGRLEDFTSGGLVPYAVLTFCVQADVWFVGQRVHSCVRNAYDDGKRRSLHSGRVPQPTHPWPSILEVWGVYWCARYGVYYFLRSLPTLTSCRLKVAGNLIPPKDRSVIGNFSRGCPSSWILSRSLSIKNDCTRFCCKNAYVFVRKTHELKHSCNVTFFLFSKTDLYYSLDN